MFVTEGVTSNITNIDYEHATIGAELIINF
jgi:hypothetical protein